MSTASGRWAAEDVTRNRSSRLRAEFDNNSATFPSFSGIHSTLGSSFRKSVSSRRDLTGGAGDPAAHAAGSPDTARNDRLALSVCPEIRYGRTATAIPEVTG